jgi:hypothetical protein
VHAYLVYLRSLPYSGQLYWKSFNEPPRGPFSKRALKTDFDGQFDLTYNPLQSLLSLVHRLTEQEVPWWTLRSSDLLERVHYPVTEASEEWADEIMALDKLVVEGFETQYLGAKARDLKQEPRPRDALISLIQLCLQGLGFTEQLAKETIAPLRVLHNLRSKLKGHVAGADAALLREEALREHGTYPKHFSDLCARCDQSMKLIADTFGQP